jgi:glucokinase
MQNFIGIDIGGSKIDGLLLNREGLILAEHRQPTAAHEGPEALTARVAEAVKHLSAAGPLAGIGIGCPGHVDSRGGVVREAVNLGWHEWPLREHLQSLLHTPPPIALANDVNAAALGEWQFGGRPESLLYLAIGTGLGGAAILGGKLVEGAGQFAMEIGHWAMTPGGRACKCGLQGCPEAYLSGVGLAAALAEKAPDYPASDLTPPPAPEQTTAAILTAARAGDPLGLAIMEDAALTLARLLAASASFYNPQCIAIGGGLGLAAADLLLAPAVELLKDFVLPPAYAGLEVKTASVARIAIGAACLAFPEHQST